jgi:hypothetical protein
MVSPSSILFSGRNPQLLSLSDRLRSLGCFHKQLKAELGRPKVARAAGGL